MNNKTLTIAIPTFNRHEKLLKTLNSLNIFRDKFLFKVIVIDNCSQPPINEYLSDNGYSGFEYTHVQRNYGNVGMAANILLTFVNSNSEWMWLLGDDDPPLPNCLIDIYSELELTTENDFLIKFNSHAGGFPDVDMILSSEKDYIKFCSNFSYYSNMLFMSNSIYRVNAMQNHLRIMFEFNNTLAPFLIGNLKNLSENKRIKIINKFIVEHGRVEAGQTWDSHKLREGILHFSDLEGHAEFKSKVLPKLLKDYISPGWFYIYLFIYPFRYGNYNADYWRWFYQKSSFLFTGFRSYYLSFLAKTIKYYYTSKIINKIISKRIKIKLISNLDRS